MLIIAPQERIETYYFEDEFVGQSQLKKLLKGIDDFGKQEDSTKEHFLIGSAVDCLLTANEGEFEKQYYILPDKKKPSEKIAKILNRVYEKVRFDYQESIRINDIQVPVYETVTEPKVSVPITPPKFNLFAGSLSHWEAYILEACKEEEYQSNWGDAAKLKAVLVSGVKYFEAMVESFGKTILSGSQYDKIRAIEYTLRYNSKTKRFFDRETLAGEKYITAFYQLPIYFEYRGIKSKALLDMVYVFYNTNGQIEKIIPCDLKTMSGNTANFVESLKQRRYDIQGAWYKLALSKHFQVPLDKISDFHFVVESTTKPGKPLVYIMHSSLEKIGREGRPEILHKTGERPIVLEKAIKGYNQLIDDLIYYNEHGWSLEREINDYKGDPIVLTWDGIVPKIE